MDLTTTEPSPDVTLTYAPSGQTSTAAEADGDAAVLYDDGSAATAPIQGYMHLTDGVLVPSTNPLNLKGGWHLASALAHVRTAH